MEESPANSENFSLEHFYSKYRQEGAATGSALLDRVKPFSDYLRQSNRQGHALYCRQIEGATGPRVAIRDPLTGTTRTMVMMGSNNYLGLANHPRVVQAVKDAVDRHGVGMGGPPLLNGMNGLHRQLELRIARLKGKEDALLFASGFQANLGWVPALLRPRDFLIYDELHHASLFDGIKIARANARIHTQAFKHNDIRHLLQVLEKARDELVPGAHVFVAVEGVYSMDGDLAPLKEIARICRAFEATLVLDDAHGTGILGANGAGTAEHLGVEVDLAMGTFSKAFGVTGGFVAGKREVIDYLRFFSRSYMFSAHLPQAIVAAILAGLDVIAEEPEIRKRLRENVDYLVAGLRKHGFKVSSHSAIIPLAVPERVDIRAFGKRIHEEGLFTSMIEYPAVPKDAQRIRLSVMADHSREDLDFAAGTLAKLGREFGLLIRDPVTF